MQTSLQIEGEQEQISADCSSTETFKHFLDLLDFHRASSEGCGLSLARIAQHTHTLENCERIGLRNI